MDKTLLEVNTDPRSFSEVINKLRGFFLSSGYVETFPQPKLSILAACEDPRTVRKFEFDGKVWPLPQTNQMHLERELLLNQDIVDGLFCLTASYRDEPDPEEGRHLKSFAMFEAEHKGDFDHLIETISKLCVHLGLVKEIDDIPIFIYDDLCDYYNVTELRAIHEAKIWKEFGNVVAITYFPERTSPFFNMKPDGFNDKGEKIFRKVDFIICGQETFGCAERSSDPLQMVDSFGTISKGEYSKLLYEQFGKDRVDQELEEFVSLPMISRWGFGMGVSRLLRGIQLVNNFSNFVS